MTEENTIEISVEDGLSLLRKLESKKLFLEDKAERSNIFIFIGENQQINKEEERVQGYFDSYHQIQNAICSMKIVIQTANLGAIDTLNMIRTTKATQKFYDSLRKFSNNKKTLGEFKCLFTLSEIDKVTDQLQEDISSLEESMRQHNLSTKIIIPKNFLTM